MSEATTTTREGDGDAPEAEQAQSNPLVVALRNLGEGTQNLVRHHLELARHEVKADAMEVGLDAAGVIAAAMFALFGYVLLNVAAVLFSAWFGGIQAMAIVALTLALLHLVGGGLAARALALNFQQRHYGPTYTRDEFQRSAQWVKETTTSYREQRQLEDQTQEEETAP